MVSRVAVLAGVAPIAGMDWMIRKIATAASVTRIMEPAARAVPENHRSPARFFAGGAEVRVAAVAAVMSVRSSGGRSAGVGPG